MAWFGVATEGPAGDRVAARRRAMLTNNDGLQRIAFSMNSSTTPTGSGQEGIREQYRLASQSETSAEQLDALAGASSAFVRTAVAKHPNTSMITIERLVNDEDVDVVAIALAHPNCRSDLVRSSISHASSRVRAGAASSIHATSDVLGVLLDDPDEDVVRHALANPNLDMTVASNRLSRFTHGMRKALASNPQLSEELQWTLARDNDWRIRSALAGIDAITKDVASYLSQDSHAIVRQRIGGNPSAPEEVRRVLMHDPEDAVSYTAREHSQSVLVRILAEYQHRA
ncbi:MAG: hypothetical protein ACYCTG_04955 [Ferrimicrobium sp.]